MNRQNSIATHSPVSTKLIAAIFLGLVGFGLNYLSVPMFDRMDLVFGNSAFVIAAYFLGPWYALITATLAVTTLALSWGDPGVFLWFLPEALWLGYCRSRGWFLLYADLLYYLVIGAPIAYLWMMFMTREADIMLNALASKQVINGAFYTALGLLLILLIPANKISVYLAQPIRLTPFRAQLGRSLAVCLTLAIISISLLLNYPAIRQLEASVTDDIQIAANNTKVAAEMFVEAKSQAINSAAASFGLSSTVSSTALMPAETQQQLELLHQHYPAFITLLIADPLGRITHTSPARLIENSDQTGIPFVVSDRDYFKAAFHEQKTYLSPAFQGRGFGTDPLIAISAPIYARTNANTPIGILEGSLDLNKLGDFTTGNHAFVIVDQNNIIIYASAELQLPQLTEFIYSPKLIDRDSSKQHLTLTGSAGTIEYIYSQSMLENQWQVFVLNPFEPIITVVYNRFLMTFGVLLIALITLYAVIDSIAGKLTQPLERLINFIHNSTSTSSDRLSDANINDITEISTLWDLVIDNKQLHLAREQSLEREVALGTKALLEDQERWNFALETTSEGVWDWNLLADTLYVSSRMREIFGLPIESGKDAALNFESLCLDIHTNDIAAVRAGLKAHLEGLSPSFDCEFRKQMSDGSWRWFHRRGRVVSYEAAGNPARMVGVDKDVTERIVEENALRSAAKMSALSTLTGGIAHDYNNMLAVILGYTDLLAELTSNSTSISLGEIDAFNDCVKQIRKAGTRGENLTRKLLAFTHFKPATIATIDLNKLLISLKPVIETLLTTKVTLTLSLEDLPGNIQLNQADLEDVIINICLNAGHAMPDGGQLHLSTHHVLLGMPENVHTSLRAGPYIVLKIADTGAGMDLETKSKAFDPYFTTREDGTGLGLSQAYGLMQRSDGDITIESDIGKGTIFALYFPCFEQTIAAVPAPVEPAALAYTGEEHILVVDDSTDIIRLTSQILSRQGYRVSQANNGEQALAILKIETIGLMISDIVMPGMNGRQLAQKCREESPNTKVLLVSGYTDDNPDAVITEQDIAFLQKPYRSDALLTMVRSLLDRDKAQV